MEEEQTEITTQQIAQDFPFVVLQNCAKCGIITQSAPFGVNYLHDWITIFQQYEEEGILCKNCQGE